MGGCVGLLAGVLFLASPEALGASSSLTNLAKAEQLFNRTDYDGAIRLLDPNSRESATNFLLGRAYFMTGDLKHSVDALTRATAAQPSNSEYMDWLGRAYGKRAETGNPLLAPSLASKARQAFEKAVELNPHSIDALDDLFDYYLNAPAFLGGGYDKAAAVANKIVSLDPGQGFYDKSKLDQKQHQTQLAEQHLRQSVSAAPAGVGHWVALARFLAFQGRIPESDATFAQAEKVSPGNPRIWLAQADVLVKQNRNLDQAKLLLTKYVQAPITADDPPREEAFRLLKQAGGA